MSTVSELLYTPHYAPSLKQYVDIGEEIAGALMGNVTNHTDPRDGFKPLPYNIGDFAYHSADCVRVTGVNAGPEELRNLAAVVYPHTEQIIEAYKKRPDLLNHIYDTLNRGETLGVVTDHISVIGVAIAGGALACALYDERLMTADELKTAIFASSMIKHTQLLGSMPTVDVLAGIFTETFFSLPPSESVRKLDIPKEYRTDFNDATTQAFEEQIELKEPMLCMLAGSGSRDRTGTLRFKNGRPFIEKRVFKGPLANGTVDILKLMYSVPVGLDIRGEKPHTFIGAVYQPVKSEEQAHGLMTKIAAGMSKGIRAINHDYYRTRELFAEAWKQTEEYQEELKKNM
jgi:hypothetical protein